MLLKKPMISTSTLVLAAALAVSACNRDKGASDHQPAAPVPPSTAAVPPPSADAPATDPGLAAGVIIRVAVDAQDQDVAGSAAMHTTDADLTVIAASEKDQLDAEVEAAYAVGKAARVTGDTAVANELDRDSSSQSWADFSRAPSYASYRPVAYAQGSPYQGPQYSYQAAHSCRRGAYRYYYYARPACNAQCGGATNPQPYPYPAPQQGPYPSPTPAPYPTPAPTPAPYPTPTPGPRPTPTPGPAYPPLPVPYPMPGGYDYDAELQGYLQSQGIKPTQDADFFQGTPAQIQLGEKLFYDRILSGNGEASCSSCHVAELGTSNRLSLGPTLKGLKKTGNYLTTDVLPRNSPSLYNRGHKSYTQMFWDSRVAFDPATNGFRTPAGAATPKNLLNALATQALFPIASRDEMLGCLGQYGPAGSPDFTTIWADTLHRVMQVPVYQNLMAAAYPGVGPDHYGIEHIGNAIAAFESWAWRADKAPFDRYLRGDAYALTEIQKRGATYFYGKAQCASCHAGVFQTDSLHHAVGVPQFGPGLGDGPNGKEDFGYARMSGNAADRYKFRTPSLRNVTLTGPWGHNGAYSSLKSFVNHYQNPAAAINAWTYAEVAMPWPIKDQSLFAAWDDLQARQSLSLANEFHGVSMSPDEVNAILAFLHGLTDAGVMANSHQ